VVNYNFHKTCEPEYRDLILAQMFLLVIVAERSEAEISGGIAQVKRKST
jgi:hypothetical protein